MNSTIMALGIALVMFFLGGFFSWLLHLNLEAIPDIYFYLYGKYEWMVMVPAAVCILLIAVVAILPVERLATLGWYRKLSEWESGARRWPAWVVWVVAFVVVLFCSVGFFTVLHGYHFSSDEWTAAFQAEQFAKGQVWVKVADWWTYSIESVKPHFLRYDEARHAWTSSYWPGYSMVRAVFEFVSVPWITGPLLSGLCLVLMVSIVRQIWPERPELVGVVMLLLLGSSDFWLTGATAYAMPAHLMLNLLFLHLYLKGFQGAWGAWALAPWVGFVAVLLHKPNVHCLWVAPLVLRLLMERKFRWFIYFSLVYGLGVLLAFLWMKLVFQTGVAPSVDVGRETVSKGNTFFTLHLPTVPDLIARGFAVPFLFSWELIILPVLVLVALVHFGRLPTVLRDLFWGFLLLFGFYFLMRQSQGHGWGYRYTFPALASMILLGTAGWMHLAKDLSLGKARLCLLVAALFFLLWQLPLRCFQAHRETGSYAAASSYIDGLDCEVVYYDSTLSYYSVDLKRNSPDLSNRPILVDIKDYEPEEIERLQRDYSTVHLTEEKLRELGVRSFHEPHKKKKKVTPVPVP